MTWLEKIRPADELADEGEDRTIRDYLDAVAEIEGIAEAAELAKKNSSKSDEEWNGKKGCYLLTNSKAARRMSRFRSYLTL